MSEPIRQQIELELDQLQEVATLAEQLSAVEDADRRPWDAAAAAKFIADLTSGLENLWKRRQSFLQLPIPDGPQSHAETLNAFLECDAFVDSIDDEFALRLKKYLRFRHRFFHGYGHEVNWEIVDEPLQLLPDTVTRLREMWMAWLDTLDD